MAVVSADTFPAGRLRGLLATLNGRWHPPAILIFLVVVLGHWAEHVLQAIQIYVLGWPTPEARGALGLVFPVLVTSEWLHFAYNAAILIGLTLLRPAFRGRARDWWTSALIIQVWHYFEHALLLGQAILGKNLLGAPAPTSIVQLVFPRVELHMFYNAVVLLPLLVGAYDHVRDTPRELTADRCSCGMAGATRWIARRPLAGSLVVFALVLPALPALALPRIPPGTAGLTSHASPDTVHAKLIGARATVRAGDPLRFRLVLTNTSSGAVIAPLALDLVPGSERQNDVNFAATHVQIPPHSTVGSAHRVTTTRWFSRLGTFQVLLRPSWLGAAPLRFRVASPSVTFPRFRDVTAKAGLNAWIGPSTCGNWAAGAAWADVDGDGDLDLFLPQQDRRAGLWINGGGRFVDEAGERGITGGVMALGGVFADYDNDGDEDLYVNVDGPNRLYRNDGMGSFRDVGATTGVADPGPSQSAAWGDYDGDGYLDLYVADHMACRTGRSLTYPDHLYHNEGGRTFTDQTGLLEADGSTFGAGFQATWFDYDGDGDVDLYLGNDAMGPNPEPNVLWRNDGLGPDGTWRFRDVSEQSGTGLSMNTMGIAVGDYDRDLHLDTALSNMGAIALLHNQGDGSFTDRARAAGVARPNQSPSVPAITWGIVLADLNNDGWEDLYAAAGRLDGANAQPNLLFVNAGGGRFLDVSAASRANDPGVSRGLAVADYDRDGRLDLLVVDQQGHPLLYRNVTPGGGHWLEVDTAGTRSNRDGCGTKVVAVTRTGEQMRQVLCGGTSLGSGSDPTIHLGLGRSSRVRELIISWPFGSRQIVRHVRADGLIRVREPSEG